MADRDELPVWQERAFYGKSSFVEVGEPAEVAVDGDASVCFSTHVVGPLFRTAQRMAAAVVVPQKRQEEPGSLGSSLPFAFSHQPLVV